MKTNSQKTNRKFCFSAAIGLALILLASASQSANAQTNTYPFPSSGNVGIGTTSPRTTLHITSGASGVLPYNSGSDITVGTLESSANGYLSILTPSANQSGVLFGNVASNVAGGIVYNNTATANGLQFRTNGNNTRMVIDSSGNVGIGTTNPSYKLEVAGEIRSTTIGGVGGFRFPDGTLQVTAALGGTITAVT